MPIYAVCSHLVLVTFPSCNIPLHSINIILPFYPVLPVLWRLTLNAKERERRYRCNGGINEPFTYKSLSFKQSRWNDILKIPLCVQSVFLQTSPSQLICFDMGNNKKVCVYMDLSFCFGSCNGNKPVFLLPNENCKMDVIVLHGNEIHLMFQQSILEQYLVLNNKNHKTDRM